MENNEVNVISVELQRCIQKLDKLEKMINPNSKKSLILWEEDDAFKALISDISVIISDGTDIFFVVLIYIACSIDVKRRNISVPRTGL